MSEYPKIICFKYENHLKYEEFDDALKDVPLYQPYNGNGHKRYTIDERIEMAKKLFKDDIIGHAIENVEVLTTQNEKLARANAELKEGFIEWAV
jgi:hypothetical protein